MTGENRNAEIVFGVVAILLALLTAVFGYTGYSFHGYLDSGGTVPPAISYALGNGFKDPIIDSRSAWGDPTGQERYLWFPPLFSLVLSTFVSKSSSLPPPEQALSGAGILGAILVLLASFACYKIATLHGRKFTYFDAALISSFLVIALRSLWTLLARPEGLESIFLTAGFLVVLYARRLRTHILGFAIIIGLLGATHPFGLLLFIFVMGIYFSFFYEWRRSIAYSAAACALGIFFFVFVMQLSPFGIIETFKGISNHSSHELARLDIRLAAGFLKSQYAILYVIMMALTSAFGFHLYRRFRGEIKSPFLLLVYALLIMALMFYFVVMGVKTYYALLFSFFVFYVLTYYFAHVLPANRIRYVALLFIGVFALLSLKPALAFPSYLKDGLTIPEAREMFAETAARYPDTPIFLSGDLWMISEDYERMHAGEITPEFRATRPIIFLIDQNHTYKDWNPQATPPITAEGCPLKENYFVEKAPTFLGRKVSNAMPGYGFAVYICE